MAPVECAIRKLTGNAGENRGLNDLDASFVGIKLDMFATTFPGCLWEGLRTK